MFLRTVWNRFISLWRKMRVAHRRRPVNYIVVCAYIQILPPKTMLTGSPSLLTNTLSAGVGDFDVESIVAPVTPSLPMVSSADGKVFFVGSDVAHGRELWVWNQAVNSVARISDIAAGPSPSNPSDFTVFENSLYFTATDGIQTSRQLYRCDLTSMTVQKVVDAQGRSMSHPHDFAKTNSLLFFTANDGLSGNELRRIGEATGFKAQLVRDISPGNGSGPYSTVADPDGNTVYFFVDNSSQGSRLWRSDGTFSSTIMISPPADSQNPPTASKGAIEFLNGDVFFAFSDPQHGMELWRSGGTFDSTAMVRDINPNNGESFPSGSFPGPLVAVGNQIFFAASNQFGSGRELWLTDGSADGTRIVSDLVEGPGDSSPTDLIKLRERVFFIAKDSAGRRQLWESDGSSVGSRQLTTFAYPAGENRFSSLLISNGVSVFFVFDGNLWSYNPELFSVSVVSDIATGQEYSPWGMAQTSQNTLLLSGAAFLNQVNTLTGLHVVHNATVLSPSTINEGSYASTKVVGQFTPDGIGNRYTLVNGVGDDDNGRFQISSSGSLLLTGDVNFEAQSSFKIRVHTRHSDGWSSEASFTIAVTDVDESPTISGPSEVSIPEGQIYVTTLSLVDPESATLITSLGGPDGSRFRVSAAGVVNFLLPPDFDVPGDANGDNVYQFSVDTSDGVNTARLNIAVTVVDTNDPPKALDSGVTTNEDTVYRFAVSDFLYSDGDGDPVSSIIVSRLSLANGDTLTVNFGHGPVTVTDGMVITAAEISTLTFTPSRNTSGTSRSRFDFTANDAENGTVAATMLIGVLPVDDIPVFGQEIYHLTVNSKVVNGATVGITPATDPDPGSNLSYSFLGGNASAFAIDSKTSRITVINAAKLPKVVAPATYIDAPVLTVQVSDGSLQSSVSVIVTLQSAPKAMAPIAASKVLSFNLRENNPVNATAATVFASAAYTGQRFANWTVSETPGGSPTSLFFIKNTSATSAAIGVSSRLSFENQSRRTVYVTVSDSFDASKTVTTAVSINILDVNDAPQVSIADGKAGTPTFTSGTPVALVSKYTINEHTTNAAATPQTGDILLTLNAHDDDQASDTLSYVLTGTGVTSAGSGIYIDRSGALKFDATTRNLTVNDATKLDFEKYRTGISVYFAVIDNGRPGSLPAATPRMLTSRVTLTVLLRDLNESPTFAISSMNVSRAENNSAGAAILTAVATDGDSFDSISQPLSYALLSAKNGDGVNVTHLFAINSSSGTISVLPAKLFDFESTANRTFRLTVRASENDLGLTSASSVLGDQAITLNISDVNEVPTIVFTPQAPAIGVVVSGTAGNLTVNVPDVTAGAVIGSLSIDDPDLFAPFRSYGADTIVVTATDTSSTTTPALMYASDSDPTTGGTLRIANITSLRSQIGRSFLFRFTIKDKYGAAGSLSVTLSLTLSVTNILNSGRFA